MPCLVTQKTDFRLTAMTRSHQPSSVSSTRAVAVASRGRPRCCRGSGAQPNRRSRLVDHPLDVGLDGHVSRHRDRLAPCALDERRRLLGCGLVDVGHADPGAVLGRTGRRPPPHAPCRPPVMNATFPASRRSEASPSTAITHVLRRRSSVEPGIGRTSPSSYLRALARGARPDGSARSRSGPPASSPLRPRERGSAPVP